jgi:23S rRNA (uracil1939-C5)-methyltransferase
MGKRRRRDRLPQEPVTLEIESLNHDGKGVAHVDGKAVFVTGALPGEKVLARLIKKTETLR